MRAAASLRGRLWPLLLYAAVSGLVFGLPLAGGGQRILAADPVDSSAFMWFLAWWPHALLHGLNPFVTHAIFYPDGFNLTWAAAMPGPALVLAPVTLLFGPPTTWNVIMLTAPALAAFAMYLLCRHVCGRTGPALVGGLLFGFSPYMLNNLTGAPDLVLVWPLPLLVLLALRRMDGTISRRRYIALSVVLLLALFLTAAELLVTTVGFGALTILLAAALYPRRRPALRSLAAELLGALAVTALLASPYLAWFLLGPHYPPGATSARADLASFLLPSQLQAVGQHSGPPFHGSDPQSYLGLPLIAVVVLWLWSWRRRPEARLAAAALAIVVVAMLGSRLLVRGHATGIPLPWELIRRLPVIGYAIPLRLAVYLTFGAALILAQWLAERDRRGGGRRAVAWALAAASVGFVAPDIGNRAWNTQISDPAFFRQHLYRRYLSPRDHVLTVPAWGENERWLADAGFPFALSTGYAGNPFPPAFTRYPAFRTLLSGRLDGRDTAELRQFLVAKRVSAIVVRQGYGGPWRQLFAPLGVRPLAVGGVWLYRLS